MLLKPHIKLHGVTDVTIELLEKNNIKGILLDVDNTLSTHHGEELVEGLEDWLKQMQNGGIKLLVLSNSKEKRVAPFAQKIGLDYLSLGLKPLPFKFFCASKKLGLRRKEVAIVGDQLFTDSLGGHLSGVLTIILDPILCEDGWSFKLRRKLENILYKFYKF